jgi:riboflavin kinase/FMN adenylyltransferase
VSRSVVAIGTFDGVHRGHQALVAELRRAADARRARAVVLTFDPPPRFVLRPDPSYRMLRSVGERIRLLQQHGADEVVVRRFDAELAARSAEDFCSQLVAELGMVGLVGGPDMALGHRRQGTAPVCREIGARLGFDVIVLDQLAIDGAPIRSGTIRQALRDGQLDLANRLLGHPASLEGEVVHGDHRGRQLGFPTANLAVAPERLLPANGVYAVRSDRGPGVMNLGTRPTVDGTAQRVEVHLFDFDDDIYGEQLRVELVERLRDERRFPSLEALVEQIGLDARAARRALNA